MLDFQHGIEIRNIIKLVTWLTTLPFWVYGCVKWYQFSDHFLIRKRFERVSYTLCGIACFGQIISLIDDWIFDLNQYVDITYSLFSLTFAISSLVLYRINLVYLKWSSLQATTATRNRVNSHSTYVDNSPITADTNAPTPSCLNTERSLVIQTPNIYRSKLSIAAILFVLIGSATPYVLYALSHSTHLAYSIVLVECAILWVFIVLSIENIKRNKVQEVIGCINECYAVLLSLLVQMILQILFPYNHPHHTIILNCSSFITLSFQAMVTLYVPLILLLRAENTLQFDEYKTNTDEKVFAYDQGDFPLFKEAGAQPDAQIFVNKNLFHFVYRNEANHSIFSDYLRLCFATESLLFIERASIFYQIVLKLQKKHKLAVVTFKSPAMSEVSIMSLNKRPTLTFNSQSIDFRHSIHSHMHSTLSEIDGGRLSIICCEPIEINAQHERDLSACATPYSPDTPTLTPVTPFPNTFNVVNFTPPVTNTMELKYIYRFEFAYLTSIYQHYEELMNMNEESARDEFYDVSTYKEGLFAICKEIYNEFISSNSPTQVNLSHDNSHALGFLLDGMDMSRALEKFETYDDFLQLFDGAVIETYRLMVNVYSYQFKKYVQQRFPDAKYE